MAKKPASNLEADMLSFLGSKSVDQLSDYLGRGRRHASLQNDALLDAWKRATRAMAAQPDADDLRAEHTDLECELRHRGIDAPREEPDIRAALDEYLSKVADLLERVAKDPAERDRINEEISEDLDDYRGQRDRSQ
jgi:hypothetical protein